MFFIVILEWKDGMKLIHCKLYKKVENEMIFSFFSFSQNNLISLKSCMSVCLNHLRLFVLINKKGKRAKTNEKSKKRRIWIKKRRIWIKKKRKIWIEKENMNKEKEKNMNRKREYE